MLAFAALHNASAQGKARPPVVSAQYKGLLPVVHFDVSPPLREMKIIPPGPGQLRENEDRDIVPRQQRYVFEADPVVQATLSGKAPGAEIPGGTEIAGPIVTFNAQPNAAGVAPPDPNGSVGPNHIVTMCNLTFQIFNKTGTSLFGPANTNTLFTGFGGSCETSNSGDPVVLYDRRADRWILTQFTATSAPFLNCVAVSTTSDPTGTYYRYAFQTGTNGANFPDYPKYGIWTNAYYISTREFLGTGGAFQGVGAYALNRAQMIAGMPNPQVIFFLLPPSPAYLTGDGLLPADLDGTALPPANSPEYYLGSQDNNGPYGAPTDALNLFKFVVDFATPPNSSFTLTNTLATAPFNSILGLCGGSRSCIPQPSTTNRLDHLGYRQRPLFRLAYRNFGDHEAMVTNQSVSAGTGPSGEVSGIRWWEIRGMSTTPAIYQEGTYAPGLTDGTHRWMGSFAMDGEGNMALGYSASSATVFPSVNYTGRFVSSPLGQMPLGEGTIVAGTGSQTAGGNRWGDYTSLSIDPSDDLTFWYVNEWVPTTSASGWRVRVGSFKISSVPTNVLSSGGSSIVNAGGNGVLDPGETVTVALGLKNLGGPGTICTSPALMGTLLPGGGVTSPSGPQTYGAICSNGPAVFRNFTFTVDPALPCGATVTATLHVMDGATDYGNQTYTFTTGSMAIASSENFDGVVAPALPPGWSSTATGVGVPWVTSTTTPNSAPNDAFAPDPSNIGDSMLISNSFNVPAGGAQVSFKNNYITESGFDGMVLEISIAGGAYNDIITAGGSFASGGYNATISASFGNPIAGRMAWSGTSAGYINSVVNLPAAANGQSVQLKWRMGSDNSVAATGVRIDDVTISNTVCGGNAPTVNSAVSRKTHTGVGDFDIPLPLVPVNGAVGIEPRTGATAGNHTVVVTFANPVTVGAVAVTTGTGAATSTTAGNVVTVNLTGVTDAQRIGITLSNVSDGTNVGSVLVPMGLLAGDTNSSGSVSSTDVGQTKGAASPGTVDGSNFRSDVNTNGAINGTDISIVKSNSGHILPP